jgi:hypothetical protein
MFYTCSSSCQNTSHRHSPSDGAAGMFSLPKQTAASAAASKRSPSSKPLPSKVLKRISPAKVVDVHCHYLSPVVGAKYAHLHPAKHDATAVYATELSRQVNMKQIQERGAKFNQVEVRITDMDKMGIDLQVISPAPIQYFYFTEPQLGARISRDINESIAMVVEQRPDRFVGMGTIPLQDAELAIQELEYAVNVLGLRGVEICTNVNGKNLTDPELKLEKSNLVVIVDDRVSLDYIKKLNEDKFLFNSSAQDPNGAHQASHRQDIRIATTNHVLAEIRGVVRLHTARRPRVSTADSVDNTGKEIRATVHVEAIASLSRPVHSSPRGMRVRTLVCRETGKSNCRTYVWSQSRVR